MKKTIVILSLFIISSLFCLKSQEDFQLTNRHELKLNLGTSLLAIFPEVSYEYILSKDITVGAAVGYGFDTNGRGSYNFKTTPFARWFVGPKYLQPATGYFIEANGLMGSQDFYKYNSSTESQMKYYNNFVAGLGLAVGWKYLSKNNWSSELFLGLGRNFIYDKIILEEDVSGYLRIGISIGKRF